MMKKHLLNETLWYFFGELFAKITPFLLLPYLTRKLASDGFGELSYQLAIMAFLALIVSMGQEAATLSYYYKKGKRGLPYLIVAGVVINIMVTCLAIFCTFLIDVHYLSIVLLASVSIFYQLQLTIFQAQKKVKHYVFLQIAYSLLLLIFTFLFLHTQKNHLVQWRLWAQILAFSLTLFPLGILFSGSLKTIHFSHLKRYFLYILAYGLPLFPHQISLLVRGHFDRIFINAHYSAQELGIYSAAVQLASVITVLLMIANRALLPYYYQAIKNQTLTPAKLKHYALISLPIIALLIATFALLPEKMYLMLLGQDFIGVKYYVICYLLGFGLTAPYLLLVNHYFYHGNNLNISKITFSASVLYIILLIFFVKINIHAIPFALIISQIFTIILLWHQLNRPSFQAA